VKSGAGEGTRTIRLAAPRKPTTLARHSQFSFIRRCHEATDWEAVHPTNADLTGILDISRAPEPDYRSDVVRCKQAEMHPIVGRLLWSQIDAEIIAV